MVSMPLLLVFNCTNYGRTFVTKARLMSFRNYLLVWFGSTTSHLLSLIKTKTVTRTCMHLKCLQYWPEDIKGVFKHGGVLIKYVGIKETFDYNIRSLAITKDGETRRLNQFHFKSWPDKNVPDTTWCLVDFWRVVAKCDDTSTSPILVHCR
ncbi:tyrosine-protein phosphatase 11-like [Dreissena polymorpha]|uniref:tyrosine-protein phosphatase 11-like n=1 Tax=Dreissena polymorpha TaxID=45954 RepID=UPI0022640BE6|nr:tyrosine-protein phosphatase 11-like [Dreissena polymorpha]